MDKSTWPVENNIYNHEKLSRMKELGGKTGVLVRLYLPWMGGGTESGSNPHSGAIVWVRGEIFKAESETANLCKSKGNEN